MNVRRIEVLSRECDPDTYRFPCVVDGYMIPMTLDQIKYDVAHGATITER